MGVMLTEVAPWCVAVRAALYKRKRHVVYGSRGPRVVPRAPVGRNTPEGLSNGNRAGEKRLAGRKVKAWALTVVRQRRIARRSRSGAEVRAPAFKVTTRWVPKVTPGFEGWRCGLRRSRRRHPRANFTAQVAMRGEASRLWLQGTGHGMEADLKQTQQDGGGERLKLVKRLTDLRNGDALELSAASDRGHDRAAAPCHDHGVGVHGEEQQREGMVALGGSRVGDEGSVYGDGKNGSRRCLANGAEEQGRLDGESAPVRGRDMVVAG
jgi:hypothetical protein